MHIAILGAVADRYSGPIQPFKRRIHTWTSFRMDGAWYLERLDVSSRESARFAQLLVATFSADADVEVHTVAPASRRDESVAAWVGCLPLLKARGVRVLGLSSEIDVPVEQLPALYLAAEAEGMVLCVDASRGEAPPATVLRVGVSHAAPPGKVLYVDPEVEPNDPQAGLVVSQGVALGQVLASVARITREEPNGDVASWRGALLGRAQESVELTLDQAIERLPLPRKAQLAKRVACRFLHAVARDVEADASAKLHKLLLDTLMSDAYLDRFSQVGARELQKADRPGVAGAVASLYGWGSPGGHGQGKGLLRLCEIARLYLPAGEAALQRLDVETPLRPRREMEVDRAALRATLHRVHAVLPTPDPEYLARLVSAKGQKVPAGPSVGSAGDAVGHQFATWAMLLQVGQRRRDRHALANRVSDHMEDVFGELEAPVSPKA